METHRGVRRHYHTKHCHATVVSLGRFTATLLTSQAKFSFDTEDTGPAYTHPEISTSDKTHRRLVFPEIPSVLRVCQYPGCAACAVSLGTNYVYETASAAQSGFGIRLAAADWVSNRSVQRPNWTNAGAAPLHRRPPAAVPAPRLVPVHENALWASARFSSPVVHSLCRSGSPWASVGSG